MYYVITVSDSIMTIDEVSIKGKKVFLKITSVFLLLSETQKITHTHTHTHTCAHTHFSRDVWYSTHRESRRSIIFMLQFQYLYQETIDSKIK